MGMGEPLYNLDHVSDAIDVISDGDGIAIGRRRITVSTSGVVPKMTELGEPDWRRALISEFNGLTEMEAQLAQLESLGTKLAA